MAFFLPILPDVRPADRRANPEPAQTLHPVLVPGDFARIEEFGGVGGRDVEDVAGEVQSGVCAGASD